MGSRDRSRSRDRSPGRRRDRSRDRDRDRRKDRRDRDDRDRDSDRRRERGRDHGQGSNAEPLRRRGDDDERRQQRRRRESGEGFSKEAHDKEEASEEKQAPNFEVSGKLLEDTNTFKGVVIKYSEPPEAKKPKKRWRLYVFKGEEELPILHIHRQSAFLLGKDRKIADLPIDHPSCSRQHAVLQYRMVKRDGANRVLPYIIDLGSSNGTFLNNQKIEAQKYHELRERDVLKFGYSSREYVLLHDNSKDSDSD